MALTRVTSGGIATGVVIKFDSNNTPTSPAISFENSPQTGIYSPEENNFAIATSGMNRFQVDENGKITLSDTSFINITNPNFEKSTNVLLYVNQSDKNATDAVDNTGGNLNRPFKSIERALLEASKRSYVAEAVSGTDSENDKFEAYTILIFPGDYTIDNRPGYGYNSGGNLPSGFTTIALNTDSTSLDYNKATDLWKFNSTSGGVIVPRGTSLVGYDLRKTVIRSLYVPDPDELKQYAHGVTSTNGMVGIMYDAANMIERNKGYIIDQTRLYLEQPTLSYFSGTDIDATWGIQIGNEYVNLDATQKQLCLRDSGLLIDAIIEDLRFGGNSNCFNVGEFYTDGVVNKFLNSTGELQSTVSTFQFIKELCVKAAHNWTTGTVTGTPGSTLFKITDGTRYGYTEFSTGKLINRTSFAAGGFGDGFSSDGDCTTVDSAVNILVNISNGIILNPDTYTSKYRKTLPSYEETAIFKVTGGCYIWQVTFKDARIIPFKSTSFASTGIPTHTAATNCEYSHHRVVGIAYADQRTKDGELETYYKKIDVFANTDPDYAAISDVRYTKLEEYQIVGDSSTRVSIDTVSSASPYIFNCSLRSTHGLCGMHTDGLRVKDNSFKSMVVAQFTGISLQTEPKAFWQPKTVHGVVTETTNPTETTWPNEEDKSERKPIFSDPDAEYRPQWRHYHIKASNGAFIQVVSVFAVGYADQFLAVDGGDMSITNSNSNFGQVSLRAVGHQQKTFKNSSQGKITAVIPPRGISNKISQIELYPVFAQATWESNNQLDKYFQADKLREYISKETRFKLYLDIPNVNKEDDIPELILESTDYQTGNGVSKRFLTYGSNNNLSLFRDYYTFSGTTSVSTSTINAIVENVSGGTSVYSARCVLDLNFSDSVVPSNSERVGYFWDDDRKKVYLLIDGSSSSGFLTNFVFSKSNAIEFRTKTSVNSVTGEIVTTSGPETVQILNNYDSFSSALTTSKYIDTRSSNPDDLLWKVEYTIPQNASNPKPPEKRFIIKGTRLGVDADGVPYTNYRLQIYDIKEVRPWISGQQDGVWYLTLIRCDIDKFVTSDSSSIINQTSIVSRQIRSGYNYQYDRLTEFYNNDIDYRISSNINYLYPSINEEGLTYNSRYIWNPPMTDSRCMVESIGSGTRVKDVSVPNKIYYKNTAVDGGIVVTDVNIIDPIGIQLPIISVVVSEETPNTATITVRRSVEIGSSTISTNGVISLGSSISEDVLDDVVPGMTVIKTGTGAGNVSTSAIVLAVDKSAKTIQLFPATGTQGAITVRCSYPSFAGTGEYNLISGNIVRFSGVTGDSNLTNYARTISNVTETSTTFIFTINVGSIIIPPTQDDLQNATIQLSEFEVTLNDASFLSVNQIFEIKNSSDSINGSYEIRKKTGNTVTLNGINKYYNEIQIFNINSNAETPDSLTTTVTYVDTLNTGGSGAKFRIFNDNGVYDVTMIYPGTEYSTGGTITIPGQFFGGTSANNLIITLDAVAQNKITGRINLTPYYHVPSVQSITAEAVDRLVTSLDLRYINNDIINDEITTSNGTIDVVPVVAWDDRSWRSGFGVDTYSDVYSFNCAYGTTEVFKFDSVKFNAFGYDADDEDRKILCAPPVSGQITPSNYLDKCAIVELFRPSILRASSHTWEYVGLGSGNYSTGFPNLQLRVLKAFEQYIVQGYENGGGFVASTGTNSAGDFYIGNQVIQAGGQSTFTLNVPKIRNSSESNFLDVSDIENRVSNSVINITSSNKRNASIQKLLKGLSNFFSTARLNVTDRATIANLTVTNRFAISNRSITNGAFFPEGNISGYGFTKSANPGKVGSISVDTNDRLYVSPKFLDAWRQKRRLLSASVSNADNNRVYIQSINSAQSGFLLNNLTATSEIVKIRDASGFPASGKITLKMLLLNTSTTRKFGTKFLSPNISITLEYSSIDYETGEFTLNSTQNGIARSEYIGMILPPIATNYNTIVKHYDGPLEATGFTNSSNFVFDIRYLFDTLVGTVVVSPNLNPTTITIANEAKWNEFPDRGSLIVRRVFGSNVRYSVFEYVKSATTNQFSVVSRVSGNDESNYSYSTNTTVFFGGCISIVSSADVWINETPFIPSLTQLTEDIDIESATLYSPPDYPSVYAGTVNSDYIDQFVPNPVGSKALGVNLRNGRYVPVKSFKPLSSIVQAADYCRLVGFTSNDTVELLLKPGYYKIDNATFDCKIKINGTGVSRSQEILGKSAGEKYGRDYANVSAGNIAGYSQIEVPSNDSVFFYRPVNNIRETYGGRSDRMITTSTQNINFKGGLDIRNVHFLSTSEAIIKNQILDSDYSNDITIRSARRRVRKAWYVKNSGEFPDSSNTIEGGLTFLCQTAAIGSSALAQVSYYMKNTQVVNSSGTINVGTKEDCRFIEINLTAANFTGTTGTPSNQSKFNWAVNYIIPGTTVYLRSNGSSNVSITSDILDSSPKCRVAEVKIERNLTTKVVTGIKIYVSVRNGNPSDVYSNIEDLDISNIGSGQFILCFANEDGDEYTTMVYNWSRIRREESLARDFSISGSENTIDTKIYDTPRIVGLLAGNLPGTYNLIIDNNPAVSLPSIQSGTIQQRKFRQNVDGTYTTLNKLSYPTNHYVNYSSILIKHKVDSTEDEALVVEYFPLGSRKVFGSSSARYQVLEITSSRIAASVGNYNFNTSLTSTYGNFSVSDSRTTFNSFAENQIIATKNLIAAGSPFVQGSIHSAVDINTISRANNICTVTFNSTPGLAVDDVIVVVGTKLKPNMLNFDGTYAVLSVASNTITFSAPGKSVISQSYSAESVKPIATKSLGKEVFLNYPNAFRTIRKTAILVTTGGSSGNLGTVLRVEDVPGSNRDLIINNVTFGAISTYNPADNRTGGIYLGGYIRSAGARISLETIRLRGNMTNRWASIGSTGSSISPSRLSSPEQRIGFGHCVEFLQTEESTRIRDFNPDSSRSIKILNVSNNDELYKYATDFNDKSQHYLEPNRTVGDTKIDYDSRVYPLKTNYALFKRKTSNDLVNNTVILNERITTTYVNFASTVLSGSFGYNLSYNDGIESVTDRSGENLNSKTLSFGCADTSSNRAELNKINANFTKIVNFADADTNLATVTNIDYVVDGTALYVIIRYTGNINFNGFSSVGAGSNPILFTDLKIAFITNQLESQSYNYIASLSCRYDKDVIPGQYSRLNFYSNVFSESPLMDVVKLSGITTTATSKTSRTFNFGNGDLGIEVVMSTNETGEIEELAVVKVNASYNIGQELTEIFGGCTYRMTIKEPISATSSVAVYEPGEYIVYPPSNCFIVNDVSGSSDSELKREIQKIKSIIRPFSYIKIASPDINDNTYYKVAKDSTHNPYVGIYRYINSETPNDIRAAIVIRLNNSNYAPRYRNGNGQHRFDVYELTSLMDKWPSSGKMVINDVEVADFAVNSSTKALTITRSNTKYWPSYMHDWPGIDPENAENAGVDAGEFSANVFKLLNPINITSSTYRRIKPGTNTLVNASVISDYISPTGIISSDITKIVIPSLTSSIDEDFEQYTIGSLVTIPYKDISVQDVSSTGSLIGPYDDITFTVQSATGVKSNRSGDIRITGNIAATSTITIPNLNTTSYFIIPSTVANSSIYTSVNPLGTVTAVGMATPTQVTTTATPITLALEYGLLADIANNTTFKLIPAFNVGTKSGAGKTEIFKSRIIDVQKDTTNNEIDVYLADELPFSTTNGNYRHYGFVLLNDGGWSYPGPGNSAFRPNNVGRGITENTILLPNYSDRIKYGDVVNYTYETNAISKVASGSSTGRDFIRLTSVTDLQIGDELLTINGSAPESFSIYIKDIVGSDVFLQRYSGSTLIDYSATYASTNAIIFKSAISKVVNYSGTVLNVGTIISKVASGSSTGRDFIRLTSVTDLQIGDELLTINGSAPESFPIYIKNIVGSDVFLQRYSGSTLIDYSATYASTNAIIFKSAIGTISNGYSIITLDNGIEFNHILTTLYTGDLSVYSSLSDVTVTHTSNNFKNVGPVMSTFIYTRGGSKLAFEDYSVWNNWYTFRFAGKFRGAGPIGTMGWVGNFGVKQNSTKLLAIDSSGPLSITWSQQRCNTLWAVATPIRPNWSLQPIPLHIQTAIFSATPALTSTGWDALLNSNKILPSFEENQAVYFNPITHTNYTTDSILCSLNTSSRHLTVESTAPNYKLGGLGSYDTQTFKYGHVLNVIKPKVSLQLQNGVVSPSTGNPTPGTGTLSRVVEMLVCNSVQHYQPVNYAARNEYSRDIANTSGTGVTVVASVSNSTVTITGLTTVDSPTTFNALIGDVLYIKTTSNSNYVLLGTIKSITFGSTTTIILTTNSKNSYSGNMSGNVLTVISPSGLKTASVGEFDGSVVAKGAKGGNTVGNDVRGYNTYNFSFDIQRRNYNTTPLLNTSGVIAAVSNKDFANLTVRNCFGDLCPFEWNSMNVIVTRLNSKTHLETSTSVQTSVASSIGITSPIYI